MQRKLHILKDKLKDERSKTVIFVSHCILNENARYLGGAFNKGSVNGLVDIIQQKGYGIVQMQCPEHLAWGGIDKPYLWMGVGLKNSWLYSFRKLIMPLFLFHTKRVYHQFAKKIARNIQDYQVAGYTVAGLIGIDSSPTCGVNQTLTLSKFEVFANMNLETIDRTAFNDTLYRELLIPGPGLFIQALQKEFRKRSINVPLSAHNLMHEMNGNEILPSI